MKIDYEAVGRIQWVSWVVFCESDLKLARKMYKMFGSEPFWSILCPSVPLPS